MLLGCKVGIVDGVVEGIYEGNVLGMVVGIVVGLNVGNSSDGCCEGVAEGVNEGLLDGRKLGMVVGYAQFQSQPVNESSFMSFWIISRMVNMAFWSILFKMHLNYLFVMCYMMALKLESWKGLQMVVTSVNMME